MSSISSSKANAVLSAERGMAVEIWRWIETPPVDGATQMATDQAILEHADIIDCPTMRVYSWQPFCISLGYHQSEDRIDLSRCAGDAIDVVRRPTGGRAVLHAEEVTYSVIIPHSSPLCGASISETYARISQGLAKGIQTLGVPAEMEKRSIDLHSHYKTSLSVSCFSAAALSEILVQGKKLVGSAQRRLPSGVLQHGSILTGDYHQRLPRYLKDCRPDQCDRMEKIIASKTISIGEYLGQDVPFGDVAQAIRKGVTEIFGIRFEDGSLTDEEAAQVEAFRQRFALFSSSDT